MTSVSEIEQQLTAVLNRVAQNLNLQKYSFNLNLNAQKGDGFLGEFYKVSILDEETHTQIDLALKKAPTNQKRREETNIEEAYMNETRFYSVVHPALRRFEEENGVLKPFRALPEYFTSVEKPGEEIIAFRDITTTGFVLREKNLLLDDDHARLIFKTYGHFHSISFCLKKKKPKLFEELTDPFFDVVKALPGNEGFCTILAEIVKKSFEALVLDEDEGLREKFRAYVDNCVDIFAESVEYKGKHCGILHGDCWSNNMMFKYQDQSYSKLEKINLLDFQLVRVGTPVYDLSYCFYTGGSKELFDKLEEYLDVYHASFSEWANELGCDSKDILPREILTQEWKEYSKFGMLMALILAKIKLISREDSIKIAERSNEDENSDENNAKEFVDMGDKEDNEIFNQRVRDILVHMYEIDAL